jgi:hypothetical protein
LPPSEWNLDLLGKTLRTLAKLHVHIVRVPVLMDEPPDNEPGRVDAEGTPVLLAR